MMKKILACILTAILVFSSQAGLGATYTLPEKMHNQLAIGSGLKGTFRITTEGGKLVTPFLNAVSDADFELRGMSSGDDIHYYVFQTDEKDNQSGLSELYRTNGVYYFRSDMVQGKILAFPTAESLAGSILPVKNSENPSMVPFMMKILSLNEKEYDDRWKPILTKYQNSLEMWLADFTVQADVVKQENGSSALVFTYVIPMEQAKVQMLNLFREIITDPDFSDLLATVMTDEEQAIYANEKLMDYYQASLDSLDLSGEIKMNKRVSALGEVLSSSIELPLDERTTGYQSLMIEDNGTHTVFHVQGKERIIVFSLPSDFRDASEENRSLWFTSVSPSGEGEQANISIRMDIQKTSKEYNDEERSHLEEDYSIIIRQDDEYLPEGFDKQKLTETEEIHAKLTLHYYSKYSQNSATTLEVTAKIEQGDSSVSFDGKFKTSAPWLFMPFELIDPIQIDPANLQEFLAYFTDWVSNAPSMIRHTETSETAAVEPADQNTPESPEESTSEPNERPQGETDEQHETEAAEQIKPSAGAIDESMEAQPLDTEEPDQEDHE